jgi:ABC-2 type transport system permease protein
MRGIWPIYKRELGQLFHAPGTYIVFALLYFIMGMIFNNMLVEFSDLSTDALRGGMYGQTKPPNATDELVRAVFLVMNSLIMFTIPMLTMGMISEEKSSGTFELLATCPIGEGAILAGKYLALLTLGLIFMILTWIYPVLVAWAGRANGSSLEWPIVFSCSISMILVFGAYSAFGLMASSFTENQIAAAVITLVGILFWNVFGAFRLFDNEIIQLIQKGISIHAHSENMINGVLLLRDFTFFILSSYFFLFIAGRTLESRRMRI